MVAFLTPSQMSWIESNCLITKFPGCTMMNTRDPYEQFAINWKCDRTSGLACRSRPVEATTSRVCRTGCLPLPSLKRLAQYSRAYLAFA